jgi:hypothetical protein
MLWTPHKGQMLVVETTSGGQTVTTGGTSDAKGSPAELVASSPWDSYWLTLMVFGYSATITAAEAMMDLLIGAATEQVLIANMVMGYAAGLSGASGPRRFDFPLYIPAGSRLAVQAAGARVNTSFTVKCWLHGGRGYPPWPVATKVTTMGVGTVPNGASVTPGANNSWGNWAEIIASTPEAFLGVVPGFQVSGDTSVNNLWLPVQVGVGAATEVTVGGDFVWATSTSEGMGGPFGGMPILADIPAGSRLSMRAQCSGTPDGAYNGVLHGLS